MRKDTFIGNKKHAIVETYRVMNSWSTKVTLVRSWHRRQSERTLYTNTRKEGLDRAREFVK